MAKLFTGVCLCLALEVQPSASAVPHVVVVVWDGMRPDFVSEQNTPTLFKLAQQGVTFAHHHPVYVSSTEVNGAALGTGLYPELSGIIGNNEFRSAIKPTSSIMTGDPASVRRGDDVSGNHFLKGATLAETLRSHGMGAVVAGSKSVAVLLNRHAHNKGAPDIDLFEGNVLPESFAPELERALGRFPPSSLPKTGRDLWTTWALLGPLWQKGVPAFSLLWLSEPDYSQHQAGPGSKAALDGIKSSDDNLARVLAALELKGVRDQTDVIVVSDHGFSTITQRVDLATLLTQNGFPARQKFSLPGPSAGETLVVGNGGAVFLYIAGQDQRLIEKIVHFLQAQPFCGVLFTRQPVEGTFELATAKLNSVNAPDIVISLRWSAEKSRTGTPGLVCSDYGDYGPGQGIHASLSPFDMHNTCVAAGPHFRAGFQDPLPTGNVDIVPTVLWILGVESDQKLSGRILHEALNQPFSEAQMPQVESQQIEATYQGTSISWRQYLKYSEVNGVRYLLEGNGAQGLATESGHN